MVEDNWKLGEEGDIIDQLNSPQHKIDEWFMNYSVGCPHFADEVREELIALRDEERSLRDVYCLAAALTINARDLVHDITQSIMDFNKLGLNDERDNILKLVHKAIKDFTEHGDGDMYGAPELNLVNEGKHFMEGDVRQAVAIAMGVHLNDKHPDIVRIRELVSLIKRVHILI